MHIHNEFIQAMQQFRLCALKDKEDHTRIVQPYGIFLTQHHKPMYCCFQVTGFSGSGKIPNWRNFPVEEIKEVHIIERSFKKRADFNPENRIVYPQWVEKI